MAVGERKNLDLSDTDNGRSSVPSIFHLMEECCLESEWILAAKYNAFCYSTLQEQDPEGINTYIVKPELAAYKQ